MATAKKLVFHIGKPKIGTTFLQKRIHNVPGCMYLGVKYRQDKIYGEVKTNELNNKKMFPAFRREAFLSYQNFTQNSYEQTKNTQR